MKALLYRRIRQKYDFALISDDAALLEAYGAVYKCEQTESEPESEPGSVPGSGSIPYVRYIKGTGTVQCCFAAEENTRKKTVRSCELKEGSAAEILQITENHMYLTAEPKEGLISLHGAAVAKNGRAVLMLAPTHSGKSTLAAFMYMRGYDLITDDEIYISSRDMRVLTADKDILLREGGARVLRDTLGENALNGSERVLSGACERYLIKEKADQVTGTDDCTYETAAAVFINGYGSDDPYLRRLGTRDAFTRLIKSRLTPARGADANACGETESIMEYYRVISHIAEKTYETEYSDLWTAEAYLRHLLS